MLLFNSKKDIQFSRVHRPPAVGRKEKGGKFNLKRREKALNMHLLGYKLHKISRGIRPLPSVKRKNEEKLIINVGGEP